jgi:uncharacterized protein YdbL (DUF1318 family)
MRALAAALAAITALACAPTVNVATEKPIQISLDVRIRLDEDVKDLLRSEQQGVAPRGLDAPALDPRELTAITRAKRERWVGERRDGYIGVVAPERVAALAAAIERANEVRRQAYRALASKHGVEPRAVERVAGERRIADAARGELVLESDGSWAPRP